MIYTWTLTDNTHCRFCLFVFCFCRVLNTLVCLQLTSQLHIQRWMGNQPKPNQQTNKQTKTQSNKNESASFKVFQLTDVLCNEYSESIAHHDHNEHLRMPSAHRTNTHTHSLLQRNTAAQCWALRLLFFLLRARKKERKFIQKYAYVRLCLYGVSAHVCTLCGACRNGMEINVVACKWSNSTRRVLQLDAHTQEKYYDEPKRGSGFEHVSLEFWILPKYVC